ncbi:OsmC family protein [Nocardioides sp. TF02-7]|uniref:OsmC family protein n=1 Tax=Nocardioides sp. TF02-7 TaxID=2917724 RepID=UPI001F0604AC|nr:OsmC family protein [Nocardioides sp. TF02-7]UMG92154.1 OsmC family protein [Nocardioides sp. TF02-7]
MRRPNLVRSPSESVSRMSDNTLRSVDLARIGDGKYRATNVRGGEMLVGAMDDQDPTFTPVELLLVAIAGCSATDVEFITRKRATSTSFDVRAEGNKVRDEQGNHLDGLRLTFDVHFPAGPEGDAARGVLQRAIEQSRDRLCTVSRTVQLGAGVEYRRAD